jgi:CubicO group peptidase (beta-lactamase class C family)
MNKTQPLHSILFIALLCHLALHVPNVHAETGDTLPEKRIFTESEIAGYIQSFKTMVAKEYHIPYMGMAIVYNDSAMYLDAQGFEDIENKKRADPHRSRFSVGSTGKLITYLSIMQLAEKGNIDLYENIFTYLDFTLDLKYDDPVRVIDLMNHKGGFEDFGHNLKADSYETIVPLKKWLQENTPKQIFRPGTYTAYSNYGVCLLGQIVASVSKMTYEAYVRKNIFDILDMKNAIVNQNITGHLVKGYTWNPADTSFMLHDYEYWNTYPAGALRATPEDMARLCVAMINGGEFNGKRILSKKYMDLMHETTWCAGKELSGLAHGLIKTYYNGYAFYGHGGTTSYQHTSFNWFRELGLGFYITAGTKDAMKIKTKFIQNFIDTFFIKKPVSYTFIDTIDLSKYAGTYFGARSNFSTFEKTFRFFNSVTLQAEDTVLFVTSEPYKFKPVNERYFVSTDGNARILFDVNKSGKVTGFNSSPVNYFFRQYGFEKNSVHLLLFALSLLLAIVIGTARCIHFIIRKIRKGHVDSVTGNTKKFSTFLIGYIIVTFLIFTGNILTIDSVALMKGHDYLFRITGFLFLLYAPMAAVQLFRTVRLCISTKGYTLLKTVESLVFLLTGVLVILFFYWNLAGIPHLQ